MLRRVITGHNKQGRACILSDERVDHGVAWQSLPGQPLALDPDGSTPTLWPTTAPKLEPPTGGSCCHYVAMEPWKTMQPRLAQGAIPGVDKDGFHRTATVDYIVILSGEVTLVLDEDQTVLKAGDMVIQRNTNHAWRNHTDQPVVFVGIMAKVD
jgi:mannose-6-phosphate isomerase-like protein (cupin superfamily)